MINNYKKQDLEEAIELWNGTATKIGYKEMDHEIFAEIITGNLYFDEKTAFVMREEGKIVGFACGCIGEELPLGKTSGYITCVLLKDEFETSENYQLMMGTIEKSFQEAGKIQSEILFFNPMMLPWYIKGTDHHEHNNAPGVFKNSRFYHELLNYGYLDRATECAMYLNLKGFEISQKILEKEEKASLSGYEVDLFDANRHYDVEDMLQSLDNPLWEKEIAQCTKEGTPVLIAAHHGKVVGFAGPVICQKSGRGYFTGIGVVKEHEGHGLGTVLFYKLCKAFTGVGVQYMSLYTGEDNPAKRIYEQAGFVTVQEFAVMRKML